MDAWAGIAIFTEFVYLGFALVHFFERRASSVQRILPLCFFFALFFAGTLPSGISDVRSQWLAPTACVVVLIGIGIMSFFGTFRSRYRSHRRTGIVGLFLFTLMTPLIGADLAESIQYYQELHRTRIERSRYGV
jgi:hypothetical protein